MLWLADLCSIEQELSTVGKPSSAPSRLGLAGDTKVRQKPPAGRSHSTKHTGSQQWRGEQQWRQHQQQAPAPLPRLPSGWQLQQETPAGIQLLPGWHHSPAGKSLPKHDEAARQSSTSFGSTVSAPYSSSTVRRPTSHQSSSQDGVGGYGHRAWGAVLCPFLSL